MAATATGSQVRPPGGGQHAVRPHLQIFLLLFLLGMILGEPKLGMWGFILLGVIAIVMLPIVIAIVFTVWLAVPKPLAPAPAPTTAMTLHFAYGSNMSRPHMRARCPGATALGTATLAGWRFVINPDGYGSIAPQAGRHRAWRALAAVAARPRGDQRLRERRRRALCAPHAAGAARRASASRRWSISRRGAGEGTPRPGYIAIVVAAARDWGMPEPYIRSLMRWSPSALARRPGERHRRSRMSGLTIRRVVVRGRVQGVGYRAWTEDTAILNGLDGWVRNRRDGAVEAVFAGSRRGGRRA